MKLFFIEHVGLLPLIFQTVLFVGAVFVYFFAKRKAFAAKCFIGGGIGFYIFYPLLLSLLQYVTWAADPNLGTSFLTLPLDPATPCPEWLRPLFVEEHGYFLFYVLGRFWLRAVLGLSTAFLFYFFLQAVMRAKPHALLPVESLIALMLALAAGWPLVLIFILLTFVFIVLHSVVNLLLKNPRTRIIFALFLAFIVVILFGDFFKTFFQLSVLTV